MKIRSLEELISILDENSQRRKRELVSIAEQLSSSRAHMTDMFCRIAIVMSYAHWEGFVKLSATSYVDFVSRKSRPLSHYSENFQAVACRVEIATAISTMKRIDGHILLVQKLVTGVNNRVSASFSAADSAIDTESNLNWTVFQNICRTIGIDTEPWGKFRGIMNEILTERCSIAHGELVTPELKSANEAISFTVDGIDALKTAIINAASTEAYIRPEFRNS